MQVMAELLENGWLGIEPMSSCAFTSSLLSCYLIFHSMMTFLI